MSDPTAPRNGDDPENDVSSENTTEANAEPIDVNELLESTRKLFEPEELQRAMEQAGYTPDSAGETSDKPNKDAKESEKVDRVDAPGQVQSETVTDSGDKKLADEKSAEPGHTPVDPEQGTNIADEDTVDQFASGVVVAEQPPLRGVNLLSIVALVLALALSPLAVIFGYIALGQTRRARQRGETLALWAMGLGWLVFAAWVVLLASLMWIGYQEGITWDSLREFIELFSLP